MSQNFYIQLFETLGEEIFPLDPPIEDSEVLLQLLKKAQTKWSSDANSPSLQRKEQGKQMLAQIDIMQAFFRLSASEREHFVREAAAYYRNLQQKNREKLAAEIHIILMSDVSGNTEKTLQKIRRKWKGKLPDTVIESEILKAQNIDDDNDISDRNLFVNTLDDGTANSVVMYLAKLGYETLYDLVYANQNASFDVVRGKVRQYNDEVQAIKKDPAKDEKFDAQKRLASYALDLLCDAEKRKRYDNWLMIMPVQNALNNELMMIVQSGNNAISQKLFDHLVDEAVNNGIRPALARNYIQFFAEQRKWKIVNRTGPSQLFREIEELFQQKKYYEARKPLAELAKEHADSSRLPILQCELDEQIKQCEQQLELAGGAVVVSDRIKYLQRALRLCVDHPTLRQMLDEIPAPESPTDLNVIDSVQVIKLTWTAPKSESGLNYLIVRTNDRAPTGLNDGTTIAELSGTSYDDATVPFGVPVGYAVFSKRDAVVSKNAVCCHPVVRMQEIENLYAVPDDHAVRLQWKLPDSCHSVMITKSMVQQAGKQTEASTRLDRISVVTDTRVQNGKQYEFRVAACYTCGSRTVTTPGLACTVVPSVPSLPVALTQINGESPQLIVTWSTPQEGTVVVITSENKIPLFPKQVLAYHEIQRYGEVIHGHSKGEAVINRRFAKNLYIVPVTIRGDQAVCGRMYLKKMTPVPLRNIKKQVTSDRITLDWHWDDQTDAMIIAYSLNGTPNNLNAPDSRKFRVPRNEGERAGSYTFSCDATDPVFVSLFAEVHYSDGDVRYSTPCSIECQYYQLSEITYEISREWSWLGKGGLMLDVYASHLNSYQPEMVLVKKTGVIPLSINDGTEILNIPKSETPDDFRLSIDTIEPGSFASLFFKNRSDTNRFRLLPPVRFSQELTVEKSRSLKTYPLFAEKERVPKNRDNIIAVLGTRNAGKSHYIAVLINELKNKVGNLFQWSLRAGNDETIRRYHEDFYKPVYMQHTTIRATHSAASDQSVMTPLEYIIDFMDRRNGIIQTVRLKFYDVAGEDLGNQKIMEKYVAHIKEAAGLLFLIDPLQIDVVRKSLPKSVSIPDSRVLEQANSRADEVIDRIINTIGDSEESANRFRGQEKIPVPISVTFTKMDALIPFLPPGNPFCYPSRHRGMFSLAEYNDINGTMHNYCRQWLGGFVNKIQLFKYRAYFGVSALGCNPHADNVVESVKPIRVEEPFLYLLWQMGLLQEG